MDANAVAERPMQPTGPPVEGTARPGGGELACRVCGDRLELSGGLWAADFNAFLARHDDCR